LNKKVPSVVFFTDGVNLMVVLLISAYYNRHMIKVQHLCIFGRMMIMKKYDHIHTRKPEGIDDRNAFIVRGGVAGLATVTSLDIVYNV
jgi:hypothetical protein